MDSPDSPRLSDRASVLTSDTDYPNIGSRASILAQQTSEHRLWAMGAEIETHRESTEKVKRDVAELMKLMIPSGLFDELTKASGTSSESSRQVSFAQQILCLKPQLSSPSPVLLFDSELHVEQTDAPDCNDIVQNWIIIASAYHEIHEACQARQSNEFTIRSGVDTLLVCSAGVSEGTNVRFENEIRLRRSSASQMPSLAKADVVITSTIPSDLSTQLLQQSPTQRVLISQAYWTNAMERDPDLLMVAVEYKNFDESVAYSHLVYDLSAGQSVLKALGFTDVILYGWTAARLASHLVMDLYASWWSESGHIVVSKCLWSCLVSTPLGCLAFYNFLCKLHVRNAGLVAAADKENFKEITNTLKENCWRAPDPDRKRGKSAGNTKPSKRPKNDGGHGGRELEDDLEEIPLGFEEDGRELQDDLEETRLSVGVDGDRDGMELSSLGGVSRPLAWISGHVKPVDMMKRWIYSSGQGLATEDDFGVDVAQ